MVYRGCYTYKKKSMKTRLEQKKRVYQKEKYAHHVHKTKQKQQNFNWKWRNGKLWLIKLRNCWIVITIKTNEFLRLYGINLQFSSTKYFVFFIRLIFPDLLSLSHSLLTTSPWLAVGSIQSWIQFHMILYALTEKDESIVAGFLFFWLNFYFTFLRDGKPLCYVKFILQAKVNKNRILSSFHSVCLTLILISAYAVRCAVEYIWWWLKDGNGKPEIILFLLWLAGVTVHDFSVESKKKPRIIYYWIECNSLIWVNPCQCA